MDAHTQAQLFLRPLRWQKERTAEVLMGLQVARLFCENSRATTEAASGVASLVLVPQSSDKKNPAHGQSYDHAADLHAGDKEAN